jgi:hypothetical protein
MVDVLKSNSERVKDVCLALKPLIGSKAEKLWRLYTVSDGDDRREVEEQIELIAAAHLKDDIEDRLPVFLPPTPSLADGEYPLGDVLYNGQAKCPFGLRELDWPQHISVFGRTGSGKTTLTWWLARRLQEKGKPFLALSWKREWRHLLSLPEFAGMRVYTIGRENIAPLHFNFLRPPPGTELAVWRKKIIQSIAHGYFLGDGSMFLMNEVLKKLFTDHPDPSAADFPNLATALVELKRYPAMGRAANWKISAMRALSTLCEQSCFLHDTPGNRMENLLTMPVVLELESLSEADKLFYMSAVFSWIFHYRLAKDERDAFNHCIFIEEAHHLLASGMRSAASTSVINAMIRECRELSQSICLLDQQPSELSKTAIANTGTTIALSSKEKSDMNVLANSMLIPSKETDALGRLPIGMAAVKTTRYTEPFLISFPDFSISKSVTDRTIQEHMSEFVRQLPLTETAPTLTTAEISFLRDVCRRPDSTVTHRYTGLGVSARKGDATKRLLLDKNLIKEFEVKIGRVRSKKLELTETGRARLKATKETGTKA